MKRIVFTACKNLSKGYFNPSKKSIHEECVTFDAKEKMYSFSFDLNCNDMTIFYNAIRSLLKEYGITIQSNEYNTLNDEKREFSIEYKDEKDSLTIDSECINQPEGICLTIIYTKNVKD